MELAQCLYKRAAASMKRRRVNDHRDAIVRGNASMVAKRLLPHCSQSAFVELVKLAKATDITQLPTTREQYRQDKIKSLPTTPYGRC